MPKNLLRPGTVEGVGRMSPARHSVRRRVGATGTDTALTPQLARQILTTYTASGDTVCDPNPGSGLALVEARRAGRHAIGLSSEPRWNSALAAHLDRADQAGPVGTTTLLDSVDDPRAAALPGAVDLVLTDVSPTHASEPSHVLVGLYEDLNAVVNWVWPGGHIVITYRPCRHQGRLVELPAAIHEAAHAIGLIPADNCTTLTAPLRNDRDRLRNVRCAGAHPENTGIHGNMTAALADLNVLVFRLPTSTSRETTLQRGAL